MTNEFDNALRGLCLAVSNFSIISKELIISKQRRVQLLKNYALDLQKATEKFLKVVDNGEIQKLD